MKSNTTNFGSLNISKSFTAWTNSTTSRRPLVLFRILFAAVWLSYDVIDLSLGQTLKNIWFIRAPLDPRVFTATQGVLIFFEVGLLIGYKARWFAFGAFLARAFMANLFALNDFLYFAVTALILAQSDCENTSDSRALAWPRDTLVLQTAWIYLATAMLKLNPLFLSGGDLYVRQNYEARVLPFYFPHFYIQLLSSLSVNAVLAWTAVIGEFSLGLLLIAWRFAPLRRKTLRLMIIFLALSIHGYALYALDVFFFSASMIAQVLVLTTDS